MSPNQNRLLKRLLKRMFNRMSEGIRHRCDALVLGKLWLPVVGIGCQSHDMTGMGDPLSCALTHIYYSYGSLPPENFMLRDLDEEFLLTIHLQSQESLNLTYPRLSLAPCIVILEK